MASELDGPATPDFQFGSLTFPAAAILGLSNLLRGRNNRSARFVVAVIQWSDRA
jgi:hypothetical protein